MCRRGGLLALRLNDHQRPTDRQTLTAAVKSESRRDRSRTMTLTRHRIWQLYAGPTQPHPRPLTTSRMTARWSSKEAHPRPTDRRTLTVSASSATRQDRRSTIARTQCVDNEETQSAAAAGCTLDRDSRIRHPQTSSRVTARWARKETTVEPSTSKRITDDQATSRQGQPHPTELAPGQ
jgi:hypothetical protein